MHKLVTHVTERHMEALSQEAVRLEVTIAEVVRRILDAWIDEREENGGKR